METKDWKYGLDIWHMEHSDHAAAREDDGETNGETEQGIERLGGVL
jgi:hypothetical protein